MLDEIGLYFTTIRAFLARLEIVAALDHFASNIAEIMKFKCLNLVDVAVLLSLTVYHGLKHLFQHTQVIDQCAELLYVQCDSHRMHIALDDEFMRRIEQNNWQCWPSLLSLDFCEVLDVRFRQIIVDARDGRVIIDECGHLCWCAIHRILCIWICASLQQS